MSIQKDGQTYYSVEETKQYLAEMREKHADEFVKEILQKQKNHQKDAYHV